MTTIKDLIRDALKELREKMVDSGDGWVDDTELEEIAEETTTEIKERVVG